jgi:hypothetical protein
MHADASLLRQFIDESSDVAFRELVLRRFDFIYASALRQVGGDAHLAREVAQNVFIDLARKAPALATRRNLAGWLYKRGAGKIKTPTATIRDHVYGHRDRSCTCSAIGCLGSGRFNRGYCGHFARRRGNANSCATCGRIVGAPISEHWQIDYRLGRSSRDTDRRRILCRARKDRSDEIETSAVHNSARLGHSAMQVENRRRSNDLSKLSAEHNALLGVQGRQTDDTQARVHALDRLRILIDLQQRKVAKSEIDFVDARSKLSAAFAELFAATSVEQETLQKCLDEARESLAHLECANATVSPQPNGDVLIEVKAFPGAGGEV